MCSLLQRTDARFLRSHGIRYFTHAPCRKLLPPPWWTHTRTSGAEIGVRARKRDGLDVPVWMCPRTAIDLDRIQSPSANSKPFANAASLVIFLYGQIGCGRGTVCKRCGEQRTKEFREPTGQSV